jgi:hypothetical protein
MDAGRPLTALVLSVVRALAVLFTDSIAGAWAAGPPSVRRWTNSPPRSWSSACPAPPSAPRSRSRSRSRSRGTCLRPALSRRAVHVEEEHLIGLFLADLRENRAATDRPSAPGAPCVTARKRRQHPRGSRMPRPPEDARPAAGPTGTSAPTPSGPKPKSPVSESPWGPRSSSSASAESSAGHRPCHACPRAGPVGSAARALVMPWRCPVAGGRPPGSRPRPSGSAFAPNGDPRVRVPVMGACGPGGTGWRQAGRGGAGPALHPRAPPAGTLRRR